MASLLSRIRTTGQESLFLTAWAGFCKKGRQTWKKGDTIELHLPMPVRRVLCNEKIQENVGKVALERGPIVYCFEGVHNPEGVANLFLSPKAQLTTEYSGDLLGGIVTIKGQG